MSQKLETKKPSELSGKRLKAYRKIMKATSTRPRSLLTIYNKLSDIYKTRKSQKDCLRLFDKSPAIPIKIRKQQVVNKA